VVFTELKTILDQQEVMILVGKSEGNTLVVTVVPGKLHTGQDPVHPVLRDAFKATGTAEELDQSLRQQLREFAELFLTTGNNLKDLKARYDQERAALDAEQRK
jgi:PRTRC genetic system protein E